MRHFATCAIGAFLAVASTAEAKPFDEMFPNHPGYEEQEVNDALRSLDYRQGEIDLPGGQATLTVPQGFYYLGPEDAEVVLNYLWGNPEGPLGLGMIFPAGQTPWDDVWGAELNFEDIGYVSDDDAAQIDYEELLKQMQADTRRDSEQRIQQGYDSVDLIGWAAAPKYDATDRKLHWAMDLRFGGMDDHTLNYELRALGREGVLSANFIAGIDQLGEVRAAIPAVSRMIEFVDGKTYADFNPSVDKAAAIGIAGLIAGKTLNSKTGFLAAAALFLKKFWFVLLLPFIWLKNLFRRS